MSLRQMTRKLCQPSFAKEDVVSFETCLSGRGLEYLYQFLDEGQPALTAKQIAESADSNQQARKAILLFFNILANFIANGILSTGARQGVYISGGIVPKLKISPHSQFLARLSAHGAYSDYVGAVPVYLIDGEQAEQAGLLGAGLALANPYLNHSAGNPFLDKHLCNTHFSPRLSKRVVMNFNSTENLKARLRRHGLRPTRQRVRLANLVTGWTKSSCQT